MPFKFKVNLAHNEDAPVESNPLSISLTFISPVQNVNYPYLAEVPIHNQKDVDDDTPADCFLQLWELDFYSTKRYLQDEETDSQLRSNRWLASFEGIIVKSGNRYFFRIAGGHTYAVQNENPLNGSVLMRLTSGISDLQIDNYKIWLPEYEGVLELSAAVRAVDDRVFGIFMGLTPLFVENIEASIRRQILERSGIAVAFVADYSAYPDLDYREFHDQADENRAALPTFILNNGILRLGSYTIANYTDMSICIDNLKIAISTKYDIPLADILIANVALYAHGIRTKMLFQVDPVSLHNYNLPGSIRVDRIPDLVQRLLAHLSDFIVFSLYACNTGRSYYGGGEGGSDVHFGNPFPCEEIGADSLAWTLFMELTKCGKRHPCVWSHTTGAHTTRNVYMRVFCTRGIADLPNLLYQTRHLSVNQSNYFQFFNFDAVANVSSPLYKALLHNANLLRRISLQNAVFYDWSWSGNIDGSGIAPEEELELYFEEAQTVFSELRDLFPQALNANDFIAEKLSYSNDDFIYITGLANGISDTELSANFSYSNVRHCATPVFISVRLMKMLQLLRNRGNKDMTPVALSSEGSCITLLVSSADRNSLFAIAQEMVNQRLLASAALQDWYLKIGV